MIKNIETYSVRVYIFIRARNSPAKLRFVFMSSQYPNLFAALDTLVKDDIATRLQLIPIMMATQMERLTELDTFPYKNGAGPIKV